MCTLEAALLAEGTGEMESSGVKVTHPEVFVEVLRDRQRFLEVDWGSIDNMDKL